MSQEDSNYNFDYEQETALVNKLYESWDEAEEEICPSCKGTGLDKWEEYDCETCYGEGVLPPVLSDLPDLTGVQRAC